MENNAVKHFRYGGKLSHIGMEVLPNGEDITVTITNIVYKESEMVNGKNQEAWVAYFAQNPYFSLPMMLNMTNRKRLYKLTRNPYPETIKNLTVILTKEMDKIPGERDKDWCLRISTKQPNQPPKKTIQDAIDAINLVDSRESLNKVYNEYKEFQANSDFFALLKEKGSIYPKPETNENLQGN